MNRISTYLLFLFFAIEINAYAAVDMQCVNSCTSKGYQYQLCSQRCSYDMSVGTAPQLQSGTSIPLQGNSAQVDSSIPLKGMQPVQPVQPLQQIDSTGGQQQFQQNVIQEQASASAQQASMLRPVTGWENINVKFENMSVFANIASIERSNSLVDMWGLLDYKSTMITTDGKTYLSLLVKYQFQCDRKEFRSLSLSIRTDHMGGGYPIPTDQSGTYNWQPVGINTLGSGLLEKACRDRADDMNKLNSAFKKYDDRVKEICSKPEFAVFFSKTPCYGKDVTFQQLTDSSKINKEQKSILPNIRALLDSETKEINAARRNYGGDILTRSVEYIETTQVEIDKYNLDLYNGLITWGVYNQRRKELAAKMNAELSRIAQSMH